MSTSREAEVVPAEPVLDGELIEDDGRSEGQRQHSGWAVSWWQRSPMFPPRSRAVPRQLTRLGTAPLRWCVHRGGLWWRLVVGRCWLCGPGVTG